MKKKPKAQPRARATQSEMILRVNRVAGLLIAGRTRSYVLAYCADHFDLAERASDELISRANDQILEVSAGDVEKVRARLVSGYYAQYRKLKGDPMRASEILDKIAKVHGLNEENVNLNISRPLAGLTDEELEQAAAQAGTENA